MEEEQEKIAAELDISRDTYEGRLQTLEEFSHRVETGQKPAAWLDIDAEDDEEVSPNDEEAHEEPDDEVAPQGEEGSATVIGEPEPEVPSSPPAAAEGHFVSPQYLADQYPEYEYRMAEIDGAFHLLSLATSKSRSTLRAAGSSMAGTFSSRNLSRIGSPSYPRSSDNTTNSWDLRLTKMATQTWMK